MFLYIIESREMKSPTIGLLLFISPFSSVSVCCINTGALTLGAYIFLVAISSWWIDPFFFFFWAWGLTSLSPVSSSGKWENFRLSRGLGMSYYYHILLTLTPHGGAGQKAVHSPFLPEPHDHPVRPIALDGDPSKSQLRRHRSPQRGSGHLRSPRRTGHLPLPFRGCVPAAPPQWSLWILLLLCNVFFFLFWLFFLT